MKRIALAFSLVCFAALPLAAQDGNFAVYQLPDSIPGTMYILADEDGTFLAVYSYQHDPKDEDSSRMGIVEGSIGDWSMEGSYRELEDGMSVWGSMSLDFDPEDKSCVVLWHDEAFDTRGSWTMELEKMGDDSDKRQMDLYQTLVESYYDRSETEEYLELWE